MKNNLRLLTILFGILAINPLPFRTDLTSAQEIKETGLTERAKVAIDGIDGIRVGMTIPEAARSAGIQLVQRQSGGEPYCLYFKPAKGLTGVDFMVTDGRISRVDITNPRVTTISGAKIRDTEIRIKSLYPRQIKVTPHEYVPNGHYLTFVPRDSQDKNYRIVFETENGYVTRYRAGKLPEVGYIEGCV
jgi:hypothetical protein